MKPIKLIINTKTQKYPIYIGANLISKLSKILDNHSIKFKKCLIIVDKNVPKRFILKVKKSIKKESYIYYFNANEKNKSQKTVNSILKTLLIKNFSRND